MTWSLEFLLVWTTVVIVILVVADLVLRKLERWDESTSRDHKNEG